MEEEKDPAKEDVGKEGPKARKRSVKWIALILIVLLLGGGGYAAWLYLGKATLAKVQEEGNSGKEKDAKKAPVPKVIFPLESFIVNLMEKSSTAKRYLKVTMALELDNEAAKARVEKQQLPLRDTIILLLSAQGLDDISTVEGKLGLKQEILSRVNQILGTGTVSRIYFSEFIVQ